ncbi:MAG: hypothetical protein R6W68_14530 [Ignavibacteriaceae bacterium]
MQDRINLNKKELEIILHLLENAEESIIRHNLKVNNEEFNISDIDMLRMKIMELLKQFS